jgi:hypothetical protein
MTTLEKAGEEPPKPDVIPAPEPKPKDDEDKPDESIAVKAFDAISLISQQHDVAILDIAKTLQTDSHEAAKIAQKANDDLVLRLQQVSEEKGAIAQEASREAERANAAEAKAVEIEPLTKAVSGFQSAAADAVQREFGRMTRIEANAVLKAAKNPETFLASIDALYVQHFERITTSLAAVSQLYVTATGKELDMPTVAEQHILQSKEQLLELAGEHTADSLLSGVEECVSSWGSRSLVLEN